jgi:hypothetical protein
MNPEDERKIVTAVLDWIDLRFAKLCAERSQSKKNHAMPLDDHDTLDCYRQAIQDARMKFTTDYKPEDLGLI